MVANIRTVTVGDAILNLQTTLASSNVGCVTQCLQTTESTDFAVVMVDGVPSGVSNITACEAWITPCLSMSGCSASSGNTLYPIALPG